MGSHSELVRRQRWEKAYKTTAEEAKNELELSQLEIVGWFSFRAAGGLLSSDLVFHNQHFRRPEDLALVIWREGPSQMTVEVYSKSENDALTTDDFRWGSVRLSADIRHMRESIELAMRMKLSDDSYLRTYDSDEPLSNLELLKRRAEAVSDRLFGFLHRGKEEEYNQKVRGLIGDGRLPSRSGLLSMGLDGTAGLDRTAENAEGTEPPIPYPQPEFRPFLDAAVKRGAPVADTPKPSEPRASVTASPTALHTPAPTALHTPTPVPPPAIPVLPEVHSRDVNARDVNARDVNARDVNAWPGSGSGFGTAPARIPEYRSDFRFPELEPPLPMPGTGLELSQIGRMPRTGRVMSSEVSGLPMLLAPPPAPKASHWPWVVGVFLLCSSLVFGFLALGGLQGENGQLFQMVQSVFPGSGLNLRVRNEDDRLRLSWNQRNHAVASASDATLQIVDGQSNREIHLDGRQVADGSVLYRPLTNDITFRLMVRGDQGTATGSVRLLDGLSSHQPTLDVSSPIAPAADPASPALLRAGAVSPDNPALASSLPPASADSAPVSAYVPPPTVLNPALHTAPKAALPKTAAPPRYETPDTIGTIPAAKPETGGGAVINSWDPVPRPKAKAHSASFIAPRPLVQVMPNVRNIPVGTLPVRTRVAVRVSVDSSGRVTGARVTSAGVNARAAAVAISAARQWMFDPAKDNGLPVSSEHTIVFVLPVR
jgi:TonB family protein